MEDPATLTTEKAPELTQSLAANPAPHPGDVSLSTKMHSSAAQAADFMKALSHEGRLLILCHLVEGEKTVSELEALIGARQAAVSQNLARLREDDMVHARREGRVVHYSLRDQNVKRTIMLLYDMFCGT